MSGLEDIEKVLRKHKNYLKENFYIKKIGIFGSYTRGEETSKSDVDILVEFSEPLGWEFFDLKEFLEEILSKKVDLVTENGIRPQMKEKILNEVIYV
jgi:predicted nucleotidyltransferase